MIGTHFGGEATFLPKGQFLMSFQLKNCDFVMRLTDEIIDHYFLNLQYIYQKNYELVVGY